MAGGVTRMLTLAAMKATLLRRSFTGVRAASGFSGLLAGLAQATLLIWLAWRDTPATADLLALAMAGVAVGWVVAPALGSDPGIRREHLALLPLSRRALVLGLLVTGLVGIGPITTLLGFGAVAVHGANLGATATLVAVPAVVLLLVALVALAGLVATAIGAVVTSRAVAVLGALPWAIVVAILGQSWVLFLPTGLDPVTDGLPGSLVGVLRALPSGWPLMATAAADRGDWPLVAAVFAGLIGLTVAALAARGWLLGRPASRPTIRASGRPVRVARTRVGAVAGRELRTWSRDVVRLHLLAFGAAYAVTFTLLPLVAGVGEFVPLTGVVVAAMVAACSAHLYSSDGTGLWLTLAAGDAHRADVRGRQVAWLLAVGPVSVVLSVAGVLAVYADWAWWPVAALLPATLGAGAGLIVLVSVLLPVRMRDPHRRGTNPAEDAAPANGPIWVVLGALVVAVAPTVAVGVFARHLPPWPGVAVGVVTGVLLAWGLGRVAQWRLATRGPELLHRLR